MQQTITVAFDDDAVYEAQVKGTDSDNDLAVVAVKISDMSEDTLKSIKVVSIGNSDELEIGEQVVAIGNALGYGQSVTSGWISAVDREVTDEEGKTTGKLIQTDAAIESRQQRWGTAEYAGRTDWYQLCESGSHRSRRNGLCDSGICGTANPG